MKVREAMHQGVEWITPDTPLVEAARRMKAHDVGALPVGENDKLVGMITDRDIVCRAVADGADLSKVFTRDVMTKGIQYCKDNEEIGDALKKMTAEKIRRLPVINASKRLVGMLALGDISHSAGSKATSEMVAAVSAHH